MDSYREVAGMIELFEQNIRTNDRQSSKGNQLKWENKGIWYKADYYAGAVVQEFFRRKFIQDFV